MTLNYSRPLLPGERTNGEGKAIQNKILLWIPDDEFRAIRPHLKFTDLPQRTSLHEPHEKVASVSFLNNGMVSLVATTESGKTVEVGIVGLEGMVGIPAIVGLTRSPFREVVQIAGEGFRVGLAAMRNVLSTTPQFQAVIMRFAVLQGMQIAQTAACNRLHEVEERLSRWLLLTQDRVDSGALPITHDFLAAMLGTDRPSVSTAAGYLQKKKIIDYTRGAVKILDRKRLEKSSCECYGVIQQFNGELGLK